MDEDVGRLMQDESEGPQGARVFRTKVIGFGGILLALSLIAQSCGSTTTDSGLLPPGDAAAGASKYTAACSSCHGDSGNGTSQGPPLVDPVYRPGHHADASFLLAVQRGVQPHHWNFGPMPAQPSLTSQDIADIVAFVRELQRQRGIT